MSNEITKVLSLAASKNGASVNTVGSSGSSSSTFDMTGDDMSSLTQDIPTTTTGTLVTISAAIASPGYFYIKNMDTTNYVELSTTNASSGAFDAARFAKLLPGKDALWPSYALTVYARANTATCKISVVATEL